jgi:hypothetical protein
MGKEARCQPFFHFAFLLTWLDSLAGGDCAIMHDEGLLFVHYPFFPEWFQQEPMGLYLRNGMPYRRNSNSFTHIFDHARTNGDTADIVRRRPCSEIQNGGHQTGSTIYLRNGITYRRNSKVDIVMNLKVSNRAGSLPTMSPKVKYVTQLKVSEF